MLDARQIRDSEFIKNGVKRKARAEAQQFIERTAVTVEQLQNENASVRAENIELAEYNARLTEMNEKLENEKEQLLQKLSGAVDVPNKTAESEEISDIAQDGDYASVCAENSELIEDNTRLREANAALEEEKEQLLQKLAEAEQGSTAEPLNESEQIIMAAQDKAKLILEKAERDYLLKMTRANAAITQKTIAFEMEFGDNLRKLKAVDAEVRQSKAQLAKLLEQMPDGIGGNTEDLLDRLKNQQ